MNAEAKSAFFDALSAVLTEERTDQLIDAIMRRLPLPWWFPAAFVRSLLDRLLPDVLLAAFRDVLA